MILLSLALAAAQVPPPPSGRALPPGAVEIVDPIAPAVERYDACIKGGFAKKYPFGIEDPDQHRREMIRAIDRCASVRRSALEEAERELARAPDYRDSARRQMAIRHAFEGTEEMRREFRAHAAAGAYARPNVPALPAIVVPAGTMPAVMEYVGCMSAGLNAAAKERIGERAARQEKASTLDAQCRPKAVDALPRITQGRITRLNEVGLAALNKAMDQMSEPVVQAYVDPDGFMRRSTVAAPKDANADAQD